MSRTTNNYKTTNLDFIKTVIGIAEPFNSTLVNGYDEYEEHRAEYEISDTRECFLSILNKIGEDGCRILTDRVVNYIDDVSNIDTTIPSALLSQAESLGYPYKDKKIVEQLTRLSKCSPIVQNLVWGASTNAKNSKTIYNRLGLISDEKLATDLSAVNTTDVLNSKISEDISNLISDIFNKEYLYLDNNDTVSKSGVSLMDFSWFVNAIFSNDIISNKTSLTYNYANTIDFGKYNNTIYSIICYTYLYSKLSSLKDLSDNQTNLTIEALNEFAKSQMPFLYNNKLFDPIQAAWSIVYDDSAISDYDERYHELIGKFQKQFNEKLNEIAYAAVMDFIPENQKEKNINFIYRLNANSFSWQQLIAHVIEDIRSVFSIDIKDYASKTINNIEKSYVETICNDLSYFDPNGFRYLNSSDYQFSEWLNVEKYANDIVEALFDFGNKLRQLREDLRLMTLRNSYKGTTALIQFATLEYLKECINDLVYNATEKYNRERGEDQEPLSVTDLSNVIRVAEISSTQNDIGVNEYWDYTDYFNRADLGEPDIGENVDWANPEDNATSEEWRVYGSMDETEIQNFYNEVLNLPKEIWERSLSKNDNESNLVKLKTFLRMVYNSGVFTKRTNDDYEAIYSGNIHETTNTSPWVAWGNQDYISKQIHPYIWNFTNHVSSRLYKSNTVTAALQNTEYELVKTHIHKLGNIVDQYRLSKNFVDSSGYVTRYENRNHGKDECTQSYDGIVYPKFAFEMSKEVGTNIDRYWSPTEAIYNIKQKWYVDQAITLSEHGENREKDNLKSLVSNSSFKQSVRYTGGESAPSSDGILQNYCIDQHETAYGVNPYGKHEILYKENGYPFMRPLIQKFKKVDGNDQPESNMGMLFLKADETIDYDLTEDVDFEDISADKFPRIVVSKDGTHILLRTKKNELRSYTATIGKNAFNEYEKALQLNAKISCDDKLFDSEYFNDSLIKSIDDDFFILLPKYDEDNNTFNNYILYIKKGYPAISATVQTFTNADRGMYRPGLFLNGGTNIFANTYYVNKEQTLDEDSTDISGLYCNEISSIGNNQTIKENWKRPDSSLDIMNQFVQMYASSISSFTQIPINSDKTTDLSAEPSVDLMTSTLENLNLISTEISVNENGLMMPSLLSSTTFPFTRIFNINSDAGYNPIYIGEQGKIVLNTRKNQFALAKRSGAAFELLGPKTTFSASENADSSTEEYYYDSISNDNDINFARIHELYTVDDEMSGYAQSFDISSDNRMSSYRYGYASIIENNGYKNDVYRIKGIYEVTLDRVGSDSDGNYIYNSTQDLKEITTDNDYAYHRIYMFLCAKNRLYSIIPRKQNTYLQNETNQSSEFYHIKTALQSSATPYTITFENTYVFDKIRFQSIGPKRRVYVYGNTNELLNARIMLVHVEANKSSDISGTYTPNFMLPKNEFVNSLIDDNLSSDLMDYHMRAPHISVTKRYENVSTATDIPEDTTELTSRKLTDGSLVFSITETDSDFMNQQLPDQKENYDINSVTIEALNDYQRYQELKKDNVTFATLDYPFKPYQIIDLELKRTNMDDVDFGYDNVTSSIDTKYIVQPYNGRVKIQQDDVNKYTISFWRVVEENTTQSTINVYSDNILPEKLRTTELSNNSYSPILGTEHESIAELFDKNDIDFTPQLAVQWEKDEETHSIKLRFSNPTSGDSSFVNPDSGMEYKSLSIYKEDIDLLPGQSHYLDIVAPNHIAIGRTVFYNIPLMRAFVTNISDNKPKFMLTILNDKIDGKTTLGSNNYALVFMSSSRPQESNSDVVYVTCYVAPMLSTNQTKPPSISNAVALSELSFNFDVANIINSLGSPIVDVDHISIMNSDNTISKTAESYINYSGIAGSSMYQIRANEPTNGTLNQEITGFSALDMKLNLYDLTQWTLKNALLTAHGEVTAYDKNGLSCPIVKIFGCSLDKIGEKHVLGIQSNDIVDVLSVSQNSGRNTALLVTKESVTTDPYVPDTWDEDDDDDGGDEPVVIDDNMPYLSGYSRTFDHQRHNDRQFKVYAKTNWKVSTNVSWIELKTKSGSNTNYVKYNVAQNYTDKRIGKITVTCGTKYLVYTITQNRNNELYLNYDYRELDYSYHRGKIVKVYCKGKWTAVSDNELIRFWKNPVPWNKITGSGNSEVYYDAPTYTSGHKKIGTITFTYGNSKAVLTIKRVEK